MIKEKVDDKTLEEPTKTFIVSCTILDALEEDLPPHARIGSQTFLDKIDASSEEEAKDVVTGFLAEKDFIVTKWGFIAEAEKLGELVRALHP